MTLFVKWSMSFNEFQRFVMLDWNSLKMTRFWEKQLLSLIIWVDIQSVLNQVIPFFFGLAHPKIEENESALHKGEAVKASQVLNLTARCSLTDFYKLSKAKHPVLQWISSHKIVYVCEWLIEKSLSLLHDLRTQSQGSWGFSDIH